MKLCSFVSPAEELAQKDDLQLLFSAITSWCPPYNLPWRKSAGEVLMTISRHGLSVNVVKYIHGEYIFIHFRCSTFLSLFSSSYDDRFIFNISISRRFFFKLKTIFASPRLGSSVDWSILWICHGCRFDPIEGTCRNQSMNA